MTNLDWTLVVTINGAIIAVVLWLPRDTRSSVDRFLAVKRLPWWRVGLG